MKDINAKKFPEIIKFAFWSRESNLKKLFKDSVDIKIEIFSNQFTEINVNEVDIN